MYSGFNEKFPVLVIYYHKQMESRNKYNVASTNTRLARMRQSKKKSYSAPIDVRTIPEDDELEPIISVQATDTKIRLSDNTTTLVTRSTPSMKFDGGCVSVIIANPRNTITKNVSISGGELSLVVTSHGPGIAYC
jgi:hypothetical protein